MDIRDPEFQKLSFVTTFLVGALYFFFLTTYAPWTYKSRNQQLEENRRKYETLQADVAKARAAIERLPELEREVEEVHARWEEVSELLPSDKEISNFLTRMTVAGQESGVDFSLVEPRPPEDREFYLAYPTTITVDGGYHEIGRFLAEVGNLSRIVQIRDLRLAQTGSTETDRIVQASFTAEAYASKRGGTPAPTQSQSQ